MNHIITWLFDQGWSSEAVAWITMAPAMIGAGMIGFVLGRVLP